MLFRSLEILDFTNSTAPTAIRNVTTTAPQALLLLNDPWMQERSLQLARRLGDLENPEARIRKLWQLAYQREPNPEEIRIATEYIARLRGPRTAEQPEVEQAWISLCRAILNSNEFLYVD